MTVRIEIKFFALLYLTIFVYSQESNLTESNALFSLFSSNDRDSTNNLNSVLKFHNPVVEHRLRKSGDKFEASLENIQLNRVKRRRYNRRQRETEEGLLNELHKLERRPRWVPPSSNRFDSQYSLYSAPLNYGPNQLQFIQRKVQQIGSTTRQNSVSVDNLIRWKSSAEQRIEHLEVLLENANLLPAQSSSSSTEASSYEVRRQQRIAEQNARKIQTLQSTIQELQQNVENLQASNRRNNAEDKDPEVRRSDLTQQQNSISDNTVNINNLQTTVYNLQNMVRGLQPSRRINNLPGRYPSRTSNTDSIAGSEHQQINLDALSNNGGTSDVVRDHTRRLSAHDAKFQKTSIDITTLQHQLMRVLIKGRKRDSAIRNLQIFYANSSSSASFSSPTIVAHFEANGEGGGRDRSNDISSIRKSITELQEKMKGNQVCCRKKNSFSRRMDIMKDIVNQARIKVDEGSIAIRFQKRILDEMTNKLEVQRIIIKRLQDTFLNHQRGAQRLNRNLQEGIRTRIQNLNETISTDMTRQLAGLRDRVTRDVLELQIQTVENKNNLDSTMEVLTTHVQQQNTDIDNIRKHLDIVFPNFVEETVENLTEIVRRLNTNDESLFGIISHLDEIEKNDKARETSTNAIVNQNRRSIEVLQTSLASIEIQSSNHDSERSEELEDIVLYLNISFHQLRYAVQRQSNRAAILGSYIERLGAVDRKVKERLFQLRETLEEHVSSSSNETSTMHRMMASDASSLRWTVASRFNALSKDLKEVEKSLEDLTSEQVLLSGTMTGIAMDNTRRFSRMKTKTDRVLDDLESVSSQHHEFKENTNRDISVLNTLLRQLTSDNSEKTSRERTVILTKLSDVTEKLNAIAQNATKSHDHIRDHRRQLMRLKINMNGFQTSMKMSNNALSSVYELLDMTNISINGLKDRLIATNSELLDRGYMIAANKLNLEDVMKKLSAERKASHHFQNTTLRIIEDMRSQRTITQASTTRGIRDVNDRIERLTTEVSRLNSNLNEADNEHANRLTELETMNSNLTGEINNCFSGIDRLKSSIKNLHQTDTTLLESIEFHDKALKEHRKLHRNLTALSDGVYDVINEHGEALDTVQNIVTQLNESVSEGKDQIDDAVTEQIQRHLIEIKGLRFIMRNFTSLVQTVLGERLNQEISIASVRMRQRSILVTMDHHSNSIDRLNQDTLRIKTSLNAAEMTREENGRQLTNALRHLSSHERRIRTLDSITYNLVDSFSLVNSSLITQASDLDGLERFIESNRDLLYNLAEILAGQEEEIENQKSSTTNFLKDIRQNQSALEKKTLQTSQTLEALKRWKENVHSLFDDIDTNVDFLDTRVNLIAESLERIAGGNTEVTNLRDELTQTSLLASENMGNILKLRESLSITNASLAIMCEKEARTMQFVENKQTELTLQLTELRQSMTRYSTKTEVTSGRLRNLEADVRLSVTNVTTTVTDLQTSMSDQQSIIVAMIDDAVSQRVAVENALRKIDEQESKASYFNATILSIQSENKALEERDQSITESITALQEAASDEEDMIQSLQTKYWSISPRIMELTERVQRVEDQSSLIKAKLSRSQNRIKSLNREVQHRLNVLDSSVTSIINRMTFLEYDQDNVYNMTSTLFDAIQEQTTQISILNESMAFGAFDAFSSIASTMATLEQSVFEVNDTLTADVHSMSAVLVDFQLAFDTSGRQMERLNYEINIMEANSTNYFDYFANALDYLRQIARETTDAVGENRDRVRVLNDTMLFLQVIIPTVIHGVVPSPKNHSGVQDKETLNENQEESNLSTSQKPEGIMSRSMVADGDDYYDEENVDLIYAEAIREKALTSDEYFNFADTGLGNYQQSPEYNLASILNGDADQARIERRRASLMDPNYGDGDEYEDYTYFADEE